MPTLKSPWRGLDGVGGALARRVILIFLTVLREGDDV